MKIIQEKGGTYSALQDMVTGAMTNNGIVGLPNEDKTIVQLGFSDMLNLDTALKELSETNENLKTDLADFVATKDLTRFIPTTVSMVVRDALEPELLVVPNLFQTVQYNGPSRQVELGATGAWHAAEVAEAQEYPQVEFNFGEGHAVMVGISKHGLQMYVTDEVIEQNLFDVFGLWLRLAGRALARHREDYAIKLVNEMGITVFDNTYPAQSENGTLTGRGIDGAQNGSATVNDIFDMYAYQFLRGFTPDTLLMNPLAWKVFMTDSEAREILFKGATLASMRLPNGGPSQAYGTGFNGLGYRTTATGRGLGSKTGGDDNRVAGNNPFVTTLNPLGASFNIAPEYLPSPLRVIVSPHIAYQTATVGGKEKYDTDIIMADSQRAGLLLQARQPEVDKWDDPARDIQAMKIKESWGMALFEQGKGIAVARDVVVDKSYVFDNVNSQTLSGLDQDTAIVS